MTFFRGLTILFGMIVGVVFTKLWILNWNRGLIVILSIGEIFFLAQMWLVGGAEKE